MNFSVQLRVVLFFASAVLWAQAQDEPLCSSTAPVQSTCDDAGADWVSGLTAVTISFSFVTLSWTPHPLNPPNMQESYEISWRRFKEATPLTEWILSQRLNETVFNATSNTLSDTFDELQHNTPYEMRVCVSPAPNQSSDDPPPPECGYCNLCFQTKNASIRLLKARSEIDSEEITLTCEAASDPPSTIHWNAQINGTRVRLESDPLEIDPHYSIHSTNVTNVQAMPPITISQLEYEPDDVDFLNPNCVIENGFDTLKVVNPSFTASNAANSIELLSSRIEFPSTGVIRFTCEAASDPPSSITWDAKISANTRENLDGGPNPKYTINERVDAAAMPPVTVSFLEYSPNNVDFSNPDCFIRNGFDTLKVRNPFFTEVTPTRGDISLTNARLELLTNGTNVYICEGTSSTLLEFTWDARMGGSRVPLFSDNPNTPYVIVTNVDSTISPIFGSSRIYFNPNSVNFDDVECVIRNEMGSVLRVGTPEFIPVPIVVPNLVTLPVWAIVLIVVLPLPVVIILVGVVIGYKCLCSKRKSRQIASSVEKRGGINMANEYEASIPLKAIPNSDPNSNIPYTPLEKMLPSHMIVPSSDIRVSTVIGQGEFGVVYKGTHNKNNEQELVAVKTVKGIFATATDIQSFTEEILILQQFNHPNVMSLIGVCLGADKVGGGPSIILPFMSKGSLLNFLRKEADRLRPSKDADVTQIGAVEKSLVQICLQVAMGMEYLAGQRFVHRDLAARNCMIDQHDQIKVGDFGLSEDIYAKNYFRQTSSGGVKLPVKWMALESLKLGVFSEKSDVWSYGVTCWEVFTCGEIPYPGIHPQQVLELLEQGQRLRKPGNPSCSNEMYSVLRLCWEVNPDNRKPFTELCSVMETQLHSMSDYLDLNVIANTQFNDVTAAVENPYELADDSGDREVPQSDSRAYNSVADDVLDSESDDMLCEPDDKTYFGM